jgi:hypothetical protein
LIRKPAAVERSESERQRVARLSGLGYWLPKPLGSPQSGQYHVMPLQESPQKFSSMQLWHMANPQWRHFQQNRRLFPQQWQTLSACLCFCL